LESCYFENTGFKVSNPVIIQAKSALSLICMILPKIDFAIAGL